jgi:hypothetical protein
MVSGIGNDDPGYTPFRPDEIRQRDMLLELGAASEAKKRASFPADIFWSWSCRDITRREWTYDNDWKHHH